MVVNNNYSLSVVNLRYLQGKLIKPYFFILSNTRSFCIKWKENEASEAGK